ncbi:phosphotriesterase family protein [Dactylosporangium sp. CA-139066]|uniref:phosphotriesterase family protein n=1 Tax=Dactylosporangium sp. CA-139066 TaxID=3239930 RepID=UPI003D937397
MPQQRSPAFALAGGRTDTSFDAIGYGSFPLMVLASREPKECVMPDVETVRGPVPAEQLGTVLMHEHVFVRSEEIQRNLPETWDEEAEVAAAEEKLAALAGRGVRTLVDATVIGLGRDVARVARVNGAVDLNIIVATGVYTYSDVPYYFQYRGPGTLLGGDEPMVDLFVRDLTDGIADTGIKAAFIKCAVEDRLTPGVERVLDAVAVTHARTGAPIMVHTSAQAGTGLVAQRALKERGVDLGAVVIGHCGDTADLDYVRRIIDNGSYAGMDRFGLDVFLPYEVRMSAVAKLAGEGFADRMMLSHDYSCHFAPLPPGVREAVAPNWHYTFLSDTVIPGLRGLGVTEEQLTTMLVENPRSYFCGS